MVRILGDETLCKKLSGQALEYAKQFDYSVLVEQLIPVLEKLKAAS